MASLVWVEKAESWLDVWGSQTRDTAFLAKQSIYENSKLTWKFHSVAWHPGWKQPHLDPRNLFQHLKLGTLPSRHNAGCWVSKKEE